MGEGFRNGVKVIHDSDTIYLELRSKTGGVGTGITFSQARVLIEKLKDALKKR